MDWSSLIELYRTALGDVESRSIHEFRWEGLLPPKEYVGSFSESEDLFARYLKRHARFVLDHVPDLLTDAAGFHRCLGFVQAILWVTRVYTVDQLLEHNRLASEDESS